MDAHTNSTAHTKAAPIQWSIILPLALAQFIASYAATNMNVAINNIAQDLNTNVQGVQTTITFFTLTMAALMIPGSKLTDIWGRKFCFELGLMVYGLGALIAALAPGLGVLIFGYSLLEGVGSALMIPPIYILVTVLYTDLPSRAKAFGIVSAAAGIGSATGPLIGGLITSRDQLARLLYPPGAGRHCDYRQRPSANSRCRQFKGPNRASMSLAPFFRRQDCSSWCSASCRSGTYGWLKASRDFTIGSIVVIPQGRNLAGLAIRRHRRPFPAVVLPPHPSNRAGWQGTAPGEQAVP